MVIKSHKKYKNKINSKVSTRRNKKSMSNKVKKQRKTQKLINKKRKTYKKVGGANTEAPKQPASNQTASNQTASNQPESKSKSGFGRLSFPGKRFVNRRMKEVAKTKQDRQDGRKKDAERLNTINRDEFIEELYRQMCIISMNFAKNNDIIKNMPQEIEYSRTLLDGLKSSLTKIQKNNKNKNELNKEIYEGIKKHILANSPLVGLQKNKNELKKKMENKKYENCDVAPKAAPPLQENSIAEEKDMGNFNVIKITNSKGNESYKVVEKSSN